MKPVVIVPTYNEKENIEILLGDLLALPVALSAIVVDDGSPDGTGQLADQWAARFADRVQVIHRAGKLGLGTAYIAGFQRALSLDFDRIMTMDADFSHHPRYIPAMIELSRERDMVIGSRYSKGGGTLNVTWKRQLLSRGANAFAKFMLGLRAHDCTAGFRCYRREVLESVDLDSIFSNGYSFLIEMLYRVQRRGWKVAEVPIQFMDRRLGTSKISRNEINRALYTVLRLSASRSTEPESGLSLRLISNILWRAARSGLGMNTVVSNRPGRRRAMSTAHGRLVAASTRLLISPFVSKPSICVSSSLTRLLSCPSLESERSPARASISSKKRIARSC